MLLEPGGQSTRAGAGMAARDRGQSPLVHLPLPREQAMQKDLDNSMKNDMPYATGAESASAISTNKVLRNTYLLLSLTVMFSAVCAWFGSSLQLSGGAYLALIIASFITLFWVQKAADSSMGLIAIFVFTGLLGLSLGPILNLYLALPNGPQIVMQALGGTALVFFSLSAVALTTRKDFSFLGGFLMTGLILVIVAMVVNIFLNIPLLNLALPAAIVLIMSGLILFDTSRIIHGGETNYIRATVSLYLNVYNLFISLLRLFGNNE
jgi:modulator of FtsH protease